MPPRLPDRYQTQVRLGRDGDVDEWLATDGSLDRPVLIRVLDANASSQRRSDFVRSVRAAAAVSHIHLAQVYEVSPNGTAYAVLEWNGGVTIEDRLRAGDPIPVHEFLPNAAGLAEGLATMHAAGLRHGAIDAGAIQFSAAHPAKLGAFGRRPESDTQSDDTVALAGVLRAALSGSNGDGIRPSQVVEGLPSSVDDALIGAQAGVVSAAALAAALRAAPFYEDTGGDEAWSWRWLVPASILLIAAVVITAVGLSIDVDPDSPFLFPATPQQVAAASGGTAPPEAVVPPPEPGSPDVIETSATSFDPFGDNGTEREGDVPLLIDGDRSTAWRTERYFDPLERVKPGVGVIFDPETSPRTMSIYGSAGTTYRIGWAESPTSDLEGWEFVTSGSLPSGVASLQLPERPEGTWLLWLTSLPSNADGEYTAQIAEVSFGP